MSAMAVAAGIALMCIMLFFTVLESTLLGGGVGSAAGLGVYFWLGNWCN